MKLKYFLNLIICLSYQSKTQAQTHTLKTRVPYVVGAAVNAKYLKNNSDYRQLLISQFSGLTTENELKFKELRPKPGVYNWENADYLIDFAQKNKLRAHGHTLIWHGSLPSWVKKFEGDSSQWEKLMKNHIYMVVSRYKGRVTSWDVVNEAFNDNGTLRQTIWLRKLGPKYISRAFNYAHLADPSALLFYNDNANEASPAKRNAIIKMVTALKKQGVPIHGLGMQMHTRLAQPNSGITAALKTAAQTGLSVHISELDVRIRPSKYSNSTDEKQAEKYWFIFTQYNKLVPKDQQFGITTWNLTDNDSWLNRSGKSVDWPLLFDRNYQPKNAFKKIIKSF